MTEPLGALTTRCAAVLVTAAFASVGHAQSDEPVDDTSCFVGDDRVRLNVASGSSAAARAWRRHARADLSLLDEVDAASDAPVTLRASAVGRRLRVTAECGEATLWSAELPGATEAERRTAAHVAVDATLGALTGQPGAFESSLVYVRRRGRRKEVWTALADGRAPRRVSSAGTRAFLPGVVGRHVWYSVLTDGALYLTRAGADERALLGGGSGLAMGVAPCGEAHLTFSTTRDGDAEIYRADERGEDLRRLTFHEGIDVSPTCHPDGSVAFVSNRTGSPQIHVLADEALHPARVAQPDGENQTPVFCADPARRLLAFTHVERGMQVWTLDLDTGEAQPVSPRGRYKDPAFSADCRLLAYTGPEGVWISSPTGRRRRLAIRGSAETVRWAPGVL